MILIIGVVCFTGIASLTSAQTKIKCFQPANSKARSGTLLLDCSNMIDKNIKQSNIEEWIKDYGDKGNIVYNRGVESIDLEHSNLSSIFVFPHMQSLKKLSFKNNNISAIESNAFVSLPALEELDLNYNSLHSENLQLNSFRKPKIAIGLWQYKAALKTLRLGNNHIHSLPPYLFEYLKNLERLELNGNPISIIDRNTQISLGQLKNLQYLDLGDTGISTIPADAISRPSNVQKLYLNGNRFQTVPSEIRAMPLTFLNMNANPIAHLDNESFAGLDRLQSLIVCGMPLLTDIGSGTFAPLKKLEALHMSQNPSLADIHHDAFGGDDSTNNGQWPLKELYLSHTNLSSLDSKLYPWTNLNMFDAKSNRWTCDCRLTWLADYINKMFSQTPEAFLYYRCNEPRDLNGTLVSQLNAGTVCDAPAANHHSHGHATRLRHFVIVIGLVVGIFAVGSLVSAACREVARALKPRGLHVQSPFGTGIKYRPADFEETDAADAAPCDVTANGGRPPIVINCSSSSGGQKNVHNSNSNRC